MTDIKPDLVITDLPSPAPDNPLEALSWLGDTVEEIADGLRARKVKGRRRVADSCPLANYLRTWFPNPSVWQDVSCVGEETNYYFYADTPITLFMFASQFDDGDFPDLIDNG